VTKNEILRRFPGASPAFIARNADPEPVGGLQNTLAQPHPRPLVARPDDRKATSPTCRLSRVTITSYRRRLIDIDNLCGGSKFLIDALRYAKLIPDDSPEHITLEVRQEKVAQKSQEGTLVEICRA
jgi:hypothetical protein